MSAPPAMHLTAELFEARYVDVPGCELVRGEVIHMSPGGIGHSRVSTTITFMLERWARAAKTGRVLTNEAGVITARNPDTVRGADVAYFSYSRLPKGELPQGFSSVPPELIVEVLGVRQNWAMATEKTGEYLRMGVDRVWVVDPATQTVHIFRAGAAPVQLAADAEIQDAATLPGFSCRVSEFFED